MLAIVLSICLLAPTNSAADGDFVWATAMGGTGDDEGWNIAVDEVGNLISRGRFQARQISGHSNSLYRATKLSS